PAVGEVKPFDDFDIFFLFGDHILTDDTGIGYAVLDVLRNIIVAKKQHLRRKVEGGCLELVFTVVEGKPAFLQEFQGALLEPTRFLNSDSEYGAGVHIFYGSSRSSIKKACHCVTSLLFKYCIR